MAPFRIFKEKAGDDDSPVYLLSAPMVWSAHVESYLDGLDIPYMKRGRRGAALTIELGAASEIFDYYIPRPALERALPGLDELREQIGFQSLP